MPSPVGSRINFPAASALRKRASAAHHAAQRLLRFSLLVNCELGVTDHVDKEDMRDLKIELPPWDSCDTGGLPG